MMRAPTKCSLRPGDRISSRDADLAEEVARFFGYANIPTTLPSGEATTGKLPFKLRIESSGREILRNSADSPRV